MSDDGRRVDRRELDLDGSPSPAARLVDAGIDGESIQPGIEPVGISKLREVPPGPDQPLLDRVACELRVPEDEAGGLVQPHDGRAGELGEGVMIASPCALHEPSLVHGRLGYAARPRGRAHRVWRRRRGNGSSGDGQHHAAVEIGAADEGGATQDVLPDEAWRAVHLVTDDEPAERDPSASDQQDVVSPTSDPTTRPPPTPVPPCPSPVPRGPGTAALARTPSARPPVFSIVGTVAKGSIEALTVDGRLARDAIERRSVGATGGGRSSHVVDIRSRTDRRPRADRSAGRSGPARSDADAADSGTRRRPSRRTAAAPAIATTSWSANGTPSMLTSSLADRPARHRGTGVIGARPRPARRRCRRDR